MNNKTNFNVLLVSIILSLVLVIPIALYATHMGGGLSNKNEDWGDFGSFIGGIYGSLFSSLSLLVVITASVETYRSSKEQVNILKSDQHFNQFNLLLSHLRDKYPTAYQGNSPMLEPITSHYSIFQTRLAICVLTNYDDLISVEENLRQYANKYYLYENENLFEKEAKLFKCIIDLINISSQDLSQAFRIIFENTFDDIERLCLESYTRAHHPEAAPALDKWSSLSKIPEKCIKEAETNLRLNGSPK